MISEIKYPIWSWFIAEEDGRSSLLIITRGKITAVIESISGKVISYAADEFKFNARFFSNLRFCFPSQSFEQALDYTKVSDLDILARLNEKL